MNNELTQKTEAQGGEGVLQNFRSLVESAKSTGVSEVRISIEKIEKLLEMAESSKNIEIFADNVYSTFRNEIANASTSDLVENAEEVDIELDCDNRVTGTFVGNVDDVEIGNILSYSIKKHL